MLFRSFRRFGYSLLIVGLAACGTEVTDEDGIDETACHPSEATAAYTVTFDGTWSDDTHEGLPPDPHFSGLIGATHTDEESFWLPGLLASPGIENMAEEGSKEPLATEVDEAIAAGTAETKLSGGGITPSPGSVSLSFMISEDFPLVSLVSMIAPSPDWFVGVRDLSLCVDDGWLDLLIVDLLPYDAGTDSGETFTADNDNTDPQEPITLIDGDPFHVMGILVPLGTFTFERDD